MFLLSVTPSAGSRGGQSSGSPHHSRHQRSSEPTVAVAGLGASSPSATSGENYLNHEAIVRNPRHRPPPTIPKRPEDAFVPTYFEVNHKKNFFDETYNLLKESEMCECGLRTVDSTLPKGWTIHKIDSPDSDTKTIFFQNEEEVTTWEMPLEIVPLLTDSQILFILDLCQEIGCPVPSCLANADAVSPLSLCLHSLINFVGRCCISQFYQLQRSCLKIKSKIKNKKVTFFFKIK